jgi:pimeloyl-ACP methyl ester carboxylesterase
MVPAPGETPGEWWEATGAIAARTVAARSRGYTDEFELATYFLHDLNPEDAAAVLDDPGDEADIVFGQPCDVTTWPQIPTAAIVGSDDRLFPLEFQTQLLIDRVGVTPVVLPGGHLLALANPDGLTEALLVLAN